VIVRTRRDPKADRRREIVATMRELYYGLIHRDPSNTGSPYLRTGTNAYISKTRIGNAFVLADLLETQGFERLARNLASFARGVEQDVPSVTPRQRNVTTPTHEGWRALESRIKGAIRDVAEGEDPREITARFYVPLDANRVRINAQGYDVTTGRYWGVGEPLYNVYWFGSPATPMLEQISNHIRAINGAGSIDDYVRARTRDEALRLTAQRYRIRYKHAP
jgi:hypothetical protein